MLIPYGDNNPLTRTPWVNYSLIVVNIALYLLINFRQDAVDVLLSHAIHPDSIALPAFLTYQFLHGGFLHIAGNMLFLHIYGDNVEDKLGHLGYLVFYLISGLVAALFHVATDTAPCIGASGSIAGVMGAYVVLFPASKVRFLFILFPPIYKRFELYSWFALGGWFAGQLLSHDSGEEAGVAIAAHIGGFIAGGMIAGLLSLANIVTPETVSPDKKKRLGSTKTFQPPPTQEVDLAARFEAERQNGVPCPACIKAMPHTQIDGLKLEHCFECGGMWLEQKEIVHLLQRPQVPYSLLKPPARSPGSVLVPHGERQCSHCLSPLRSVNMEGVKLEGCDRCNGMWLESGDLLMLRERLGKE